MKQSLVSIIIPSYNADKYIKEAVDSALAQTYKNIEVIVIDDGSSDKTKKILTPYIISNRIKYFYQKNQGLSAARNTSIKNSQGEYIALLDADDIFLPAKIEKQVNCLENNSQCDVSYCDLYHFWDEAPDKLLKLNYKYYSGADVLPRLLEKDFIAPLAVVLRKSVFERFGYFDENLRRSEDLDFFLRLAYGGVQICFLPEILAKLRLRQEGGLQGLKSQPLLKLSNLKVLENLNKKMSEPERLKFKIRDYLAEYRFKAAFAYFLIGDKKEGRKFLIQAIKENPRRFFIFSFFWLFSFILPSFLIQRILVYIYYKKRDLSFKKISI